MKEYFCKRIQANYALLLELLIPAIIVYITALTANNYLNEYFIMLIKYSSKINFVF